ncbi:hypothetical protein [Actinomadura sp. WMMB 499]|uniref:hypothetical protein n=1 Tax=Actinomadura sp. WMMB 499 TaxID=1219491 RepID=UPI001244C00F|nr:hypothetical protein [Actinomadura sp. WMMB 499]QFG25413.1 hypothetical protein F7P10_33915 [Actinomadura sp. WMMB 499]
MKFNLDVWSEELDPEKDFPKGKMLDQHHTRNNGMGAADFRDAKGRGTRAGVGEVKSTAGERVKRKKRSSKPKGFQPARKGAVQHKAAHEKRLATLAKRHPEVYARVVRQMEAAK